MIQNNKLTAKMIKLAEKSGALEKIYGAEVNRLIRLKYSQSEENAIYRHKLNGTDSGEFAIFNAYCEECKVKARETITSLR